MTGVTPKISIGKDFNFFERITINSSSFSDLSDITIPFRNANLSFSFIYEGGSGVIEYSFNGNTVHGDMEASKTSAALYFTNRKIGAIWFRLKTASPGVTVRVEAWAV